MIKVNPKNRTVRECTAPYEYTNDKGETVTEQIRVRYFSRTIVEAKENYAELQKLATEDPERIVWTSETLVRRGLESLPDLSDEHGKPLTITVENLDKLEGRNLDAILTAINNDTAPKEQPSK
jgi:hypothetical protein